MKQYADAMVVGLRGKHEAALLVQTNDYLDTIAERLDGAQGDGVRCGLDTGAANPYPFGIMTALRIRAAQPRPRPSFGGGFPVPADSR